MKMQAFISCYFQTVKSIYIFTETFLHSENLKPLLPESVVIAVSVEYAAAICLIAMQSFLDQIFGDVLE